MQWTENAPAYGDMIRTKVQFYHHYGIFVSEDQVIQFGLPDDPMRAADQIKVIETDIQTFLMGGELEVAVMDREERKTMFPPDEIVDRARQRLGEGGYDILHNNCEHFARFCYFGEKRCELTDGIIREWKKRSVRDVYISFIPACLS